MCALDPRPVYMLVYHSSDLVPITHLGRQFPALVTNGLRTDGHHRDRIESTCRRRPPMFQMEVLVADPGAIMYAYNNHRWVTIQL